MDIKSRFNSNILAIDFSPLHGPWDCIADLLCKYQELL